MEKLLFRRFPSCTTTRPSNSHFFVEISDLSNEKIRILFFEPVGVGFAKFMLEWNNGLWLPGSGRQDPQVDVTADIFVGGEELVLECPTEILAGGLPITLESFYYKK